MYFKFIVATLFFVSQSIAMEIVQKNYNYRQEYYNRSARDEAIPGYTVKLNRVLANRPANRPAGLREKEEILKSVMATSLIHDDKMPLALPNDTTLEPSVQSHFKILQDAERLSQLCIQAILKAYDNVFALSMEEDDTATDPAKNLARIYALSDAINIMNAIDNQEFFDLEKLSGVTKDQFIRWVNDVYTNHSTGLYMDDGTFWRTSSCDPSDLLYYELLADNKYLNQINSSHRNAAEAMLEMNHRFKGMSEWNKLRLTELLDKVPQERLTPEFVTAMGILTSENINSWNKSDVIELLGKVQPGHLTLEFVTVVDLLSQGMNKENKIRVIVALGKVRPENLTAFETTVDLLSQYIS